MKLWTTLSPVLDNKRWELLSRHINERGIANTFEPLPIQIQDLKDLKPLEKFDHVRLSSRYAPQILPQIKVQSSWITTLGVSDGMVKGEKGWWPLCALYESFGKHLFDLGPRLDNRGSALIAGAGGAARVAIAALFKTGFREFLLTNSNADEAQRTIQDVRSKFFGLNLQWIPTERIVLLPGESSILVNCTPSVEENALLVELSYMNFLKRPGFLFDLSLSSKPSILVQEALDAGVSVLSGVQIAARADLLWAKWAFDTELDLDSYLKDFTAVLV